MGNTKLPVHEQFMNEPKEPGGTFKIARVRCKHCGHTLVEQANRMTNHLEKCSAYQHSLAKRNRPADISTSVHRCGPVEQKRLDNLAGMAIFAGGLPFGTFDKWVNPDMWKFIQELNTAYQIPEPHRIAEELLPQCYDQTSTEVKEILGDVQLLNFICDESDDQAHRCITNLSVNTPQQGAFFLRNFHTKDQNQTASSLASLIIPEIIDACNNDLSRFNSVATDTCAEMRVMHGIMGQDPRFSHVFFVPCDSQGIQVLIEQVLELPQYKELVKNARVVIAGFAHSKRQLGILREHQQALYDGKTMTLILSVITRWGTQYGLFRSLLRSKDALRVYAADPRACLMSNRSDISYWLFDNTFWQAVSDLEEILRPIHEAQKSSESDTSHVGHVTKRWLAIKDALTLLKNRPGNPFPGLEEVCKPGGIWDTLYQQQTTAIHTVAFYLDPANVDVILTPEAQIEVFAFLKRYIQCDEATWTEVTQDFLHFREKQGKFNTPNRVALDIWNPALTQRPKLFWQYCRPTSPLLAQLALRIFSTPATSVPSQRAFSATNYTLDKSRASMDVERGHEAVYVYMNSNAFRRAKSAATRGWLHLGEAEEMALEDDVVAMLEAEAEI